VNVSIDAAEFSDVIQAAVDAAIGRLQAERHTDAAGKVLLTKAEAPQALAVSPSTLDRLRRDAGLPAVKLNTFGFVPARSPEGVGSGKGNTRDT